MSPIVNPTREQLMTLKGIVYLIRHRMSGKGYVGQSRRTFKDRYGLTTWWNKISNPYLRHAIAKYGPSEFEIIILEHSVMDKAELNEAEDKWAKRYDTYSPNGYNLMACGQEPTEVISSEHRFKTAHKHSKTFRIKEAATGVIHEYRNLAKFCRERGLARSHMWYVLREKGRVYHGFCSVDTTENDIKARFFLSWNPDMKLPMSVWKDDTEYVVHDIAGFAKTHRLKKDLVIKLLKGRSPSYRGFHLTREAPVVRQRLRKFEWVELIDGNGQIVHIESLYRFCKERGLNEPPVYELANGVAETRYGYRLHAVKLLD